MNVTFRLLRRHEGGAKCRSPQRCPLARCLVERLRGYDYLGVDGYEVCLRAVGAWTWVHLPLPADVRRYVQEYDDPDRTRPARLPGPFTLDVPAQFLT